MNRMLANLFHLINNLTNNYQQINESFSRQKVFPLKIWSNNAQHLRNSKGMKISRLCGEIAVIHS